MISEDLNEIRRFLEKLFNDSRDHTIYLDCNRSIGILTRLRSIEDQIMRMEQITVPLDQRIVVEESDKVVRLDQWKAKRQA